MKASDYIVEFLISKGITDVFGYPGGVICHFMDSINKYKDEICAHTNYHEQAAAFAACGYAQTSLKPGVAFATSGPGATNLITGICNAYFDSIPTIFITGQVDTYAAKGNLKVRQRGFQETDIVSMVKDVTKYSVCVESPDKLQECLEKAYYYATSGRPGPVLLDIPADIQRSEIDIIIKECFFIKSIELENLQESVKLVIDALVKAERPCFLLGSGIKQSGMAKEFITLLEYANVPVVTSMLAFDVLAHDHFLNYGFVGANGHRYANFILAKSDLIITFGTRLDLKQVGGKREEFATNAKLMRVDIDFDELSYEVRKDEIQVLADLKVLIPELINSLSGIELKYDEWISACDIIKNELRYIDYEKYHDFIHAISNKIPDNTMVTADVGHHQVWVAQAFQVKEKQSVYFSGGHGAMGYSLPAAIGAYYGTGKSVISINGDGGLQMNIQELQFVRRENLPIKIVVINNFALGMIRHFQEMNFNANYTQTTADSGYTAPNFEAITKAYGLDYYKVKELEDIKQINFNSLEPSLIEVQLPMNTYLHPKFGFNKQNQDQEPSIDRKLYEYLMEL
ncbi:thiamine pyrophosphate-binding protein [Clostridium tagluense]|uniref:thiamine pyrophosphate-binding protein n=1 Tax=Clostridium tagluense TaxID=360422 RepID=UPI001CF326AA|nr:thiamine pyrophosphate-binding protein [Clostridium tagluense]MCB2296790.1 thiamine pyrophosphate-binding protein [Clostridium tagluense]